MVVPETYPCYIRIVESDGEVIELPTESDGRILITTIHAQFPDAIGLKFKSESGSWRGVGTTGDAFEPPIDGWGDNDYIITNKKAEKRKIDGDIGPVVKTKRDENPDLIVLGVPYSSTSEDLKEYFENFGELAYAEIKSDSTTNKSRGFGFVRFKSKEVAETVLETSHSIGGRSLEVRIPEKRQFKDNIHTKLFIGRLPSGTTTEDLKELFEDYGPLKDVYIPQNFKGFGFVTFGSQQAAQIVMNSTFQLRGNFLNISMPAPKPDEQQEMLIAQMGGGNIGLGMQGKGGMNFGGRKDGFYSR